MALENETDVLAMDEVIIDCNDPTEFPPVDQPNQRKETGITEKGLLTGAAAGLAVVAGLLAFTGVGIPLALALGGIAGGVMARAASDVEQGEWSSWTDYVDAAAAGFFIGLFIGAILEAAAPIMMYYGLPGGMGLWNLLNRAPPVVPSGSGKAIDLSKSTNPKDFLDTALKRQGLQTLPKRLKETKL